jgi:hypothetical protein
MSLITGAIAASVIIGLTIAGAVAAEGTGGATTTDQGSVTTSEFAVLPNRMELKQGAAAPNQDGAGDTVDTDSAKDDKKSKTAKRVDKASPLL